MDGYGFGSTEFFVLRAREQKCDQDWLYYLSTTDLLIQNGINSYVGASGRQRADDKFLKQINICHPELEEQRKIAAVLTAYDDLIENNRQRIALLEQMAEEIYREWFVRLRFPGHEHTPIHKGVPEGWKQVPLPECIAIKPYGNGATQESYRYVGMECLSTTSAFFSSDEYRAKPTGPCFRNGDVLLPRITPCLENGKRALVTCLGDNEVATGSTEFIVLRGKSLPPEYVYLLSISDSLRKHAENSMVGASGRQRVQENCLNWVLIKHPPQTLLETFCGFVSPMYELATELLHQNRTLAQTRNLLLNRLIFGKLRVDDLDIAFPPSMTESAEQSASPVKESA